MSFSDYTFTQETPAHDAEIEAINAEVSGPGRFVKSSYKIREGGPHDRNMSFVVLKDGHVVASVRMTPIAAGRGRAMLLGPLAVKTEFMNKGLGRALVRMALDAAEKAGVGVTMLVGDAPYYEPLGFRRIPYGQLEMPRPTDPNRMLAVEHVPGALTLLRGPVSHAALATTIT
jgi:predicted N-acetyltransferase YhbS